MSARWPTGSPWSCSGEIQPPVPTTAPELVAAPGSDLVVASGEIASRFAGPKSRILTEDVLRLEVAVDDSMACAASRLSASEAPTSTASRHVRRPRRSASRRVRPSRSSKTSAGQWSSVLRSKGKETAASAGGRDALQLLDEPFRVRGRQEDREPLRRRDVYDPIGGREVEK